MKNVDVTAMARGLVDLLTRARAERDAALAALAQCRCAETILRLRELLQDLETPPAATEGIPPGLICPPDDEPPPFTLTHGGR